MIKLWKIDAVHPIKKRVVKSNMTEKEMLNLYQELQTQGYEDNLIEREICKFIYEEGDEIEISPELFDALPDSVRELEYYTQKDVELANAKSTLKYIFGENPKVMKGKVTWQRVNRSWGNLIIEWIDANEGWEITNTALAEALGYEFKEPECDVIPIFNATDDMLNEDEMIIKRLMIQNAWTEETARKHLEPVFKAMHDARIVFYQP